MSRYLRFAIDHVGAPVPQIVHILKRDELWANQQLMDEFQFQFPDSTICLVETLNKGPVDLFVLPYMHNLFFENPGGRAIYHNLQGVGASWVMLYGLDYRRILVMPANDLSGYYKRAKRLQRVVRILCLLHMLRIVCWFRRFLELR